MAGWTFGNLFRTDRRYEERYESGDKAGKIKEGKEKTHLGRWSKWGLMNDPDCCQPGKDCEEKAKKDSRFQEALAFNSPEKTFGLDYCIGDKDIIEAVKNKSAWKDPACNSPYNECNLAFGQPAGAYPKDYPLAKFLNFISKQQDPLQFREPAFHTLGLEKKSFRALKSFLHYFSSQDFNELQRVYPNEQSRNDFLNNFFENNPQILLSSIFNGTEIFQAAYNIQAPIKNNLPTPKQDEEIDTAVLDNKEVNFVLKYCSSCHQTKKKDVYFPNFLYGIKTNDGLEKTIHKCAPRMYYRMRLWDLHDYYPEPMPSGKNIENPKERSTLLEYLLEQVSKDVGQTIQKLYPQFLRAHQAFEQGQLELARQQLYSISYDQLPTCIATE